MTVGCCLAQRTPHPPSVRSGLDPRCRDSRGLHEISRRVTTTWWNTYRPRSPVLCQPAEFPRSGSRLHSKLSNDEGGNDDWYSSLSLPFIILFPQNEYNNFARERGWFFFSLFLFFLLFLLIFIFFLFSTYERKQQEGKWNDAWIHHLIHGA